MSRKTLPAVEVKVLSREEGSLPWSRVRERLTVMDVNEKTRVMLVETWRPNQPREAQFVDFLDCVTDPFEHGLAYNPAFHVDGGVSQRRWDALRRELYEAIDKAIDDYDKEHS